jgi:hypothetical protein
MANLLAVWLAVVVTTIANGLPSSAMKDRLVFCVGIMRFRDTERPAFTRKSIRG